MQNPKTWWDDPGHITDHAAYGDSVDYPSREWFASLVKDGDQILEIGFGAGKEYENLVYKHKRKVHYRGYDVSEKFLQSCQKRFPEGDFRYGSVDNITELDNSWDMVLCRHVLEYVKDWKLALKELFRVTKNKLVVIVWKPFVESQTEGSGRPYGGWSQVFNRKEFFDAVNELTHYWDYYRIDASLPNWCFVLWKEEE